jgi:hypothetical protein
MLETVGAVDPYVVVTRVAHLHSDEGSDARRKLAHPDLQGLGIVAMAHSSAQSLSTRFSIAFLIHIWKRAQLLARHGHTARRPMKQWRFLLRIPCARNGVHAFDSSALHLADSARPRRSRTSGSRSRVSGVSSANGIPRRDAVPSICNTLFVPIAFES